MLAGLTSAIARAVSIASVFISLPITLKYLGVDRFGVWMTITSLIAFLTFADFGLGNGLMNAVAKCHANGDVQGLRSYVSTALLVLAAIALLGIATALTVAPLLPWNSLLAVNTTQFSVAELARTMVTFIVCLSIGIPLVVVQKVQLALQLGYLANLWQLTANLSSLLVLLLAMKLHASLAWLIAASLATPAFVFLVSAIVFWTAQQPAFRPSLSLAKLHCAKELLHTGFLFFLIQVAGALAVASDTLIIAHTLGNEYVAQYSVAAKLVDGIVMLSALFLTPLWPAYADAFARRDGRWIKRTLNLSLIVTAGATAGMSLVLVIVSKPLTMAWVGPTVAYSAILFAMCATWGVIRATGNALAMFLNGVGWIGFQAAVAIIFAFLSIVCKVVFARHFGVAGIPAALALVYLVTIAIPYGVRLPKILGGVAQ